ncbi:hypothetical protein LUZ60_015941 [Juncus effusus]|nr:hypothetical protein LUZ60_015941 [Juncus effusus]
MASMAQTFFFLFILFFSFLPLNSFSLQNRASHPSSLIQSTCNATTYYDFCVTSLASDPAGPAASSVRSLSVVAITIAASNATTTSLIASILANKTTDPSLHALLNTCAVKYAEAKEALRSALRALGEESYDYAFIDVSAAAEYPSVCRVLFRQVPRLTYPPELARREEGLGKLCRITLDIVSLLNN